MLRNSMVRSNHDDGHLVKSRAKKSLIECNTIASLEGVNSFAVDLPQGGDATLHDNVNAPHRLVLQSRTTSSSATTPGEGG